MKSLKKTMAGEIIIFKGDEMKIAPKIPPNLKPPFIARIIFDDIQNKKSIRRIGAVTQFEFNKHYLSFTIVDEIGTNTYTNILEKNIISFEILLNGKKFKKRFTISDNKLLLNQ